MTKKYEKCKRCKAIIAGRLKGFSDTSFLSDQTPMKEITVESHKAQLCKECYEAMKKEKE